MRKDLYCRSDNPGKPCTVHVAITNSKSIIKVNSLVILRWTENLRKENTCEEIQFQMLKPGETSTEEWPNKK